MYGHSSSSSSSSGEGNRRCLSLMTGGEDLGWVEGRKQEGGGRREEGGGRREEGGSIPMYIRKREGGGRREEGGGRREEGGSIPTYIRKRWSCVHAHAHRREGLCAYVVHREEVITQCVCL